MRARGAMLIYRTGHVYVMISTRRYSACQVVEIKAEGWGSCGDSIARHKILTMHLICDSCEIEAFTAILE